jgi:hypothetical protein
VLIVSRRVASLGRLQAIAQKELRAWLNSNHETAWKMRPHFPEIKSNKSCFDKLCPPCFPYAPSVSKQQGMQAEWAETNAMIVCCPCAGWSPPPSSRKSADMLVDSTDNVLWAFACRCPSVFVFKKLGPLNGIVNALCCLCSTPTCVCHPNCCVPKVGTSRQQALQNVATLSPRGGCL